MARRKFLRWRKVPRHPGLQKCGRHYYSDFTVRGVRWRRALGGDFETAKVLLEALKRRARLASAGLVDNEYPLGLLHDDWAADCRARLRHRTVESYEGAFKHLWQMFAKTRMVSTVTSAALNTYLERRRAEGASHRTRELELTTLRAMLTFGAREGIIERNPVQYYRMPGRREGEARPEPQIFTSDEYERLLNHEHCAGGKERSSGTRPCACRDLWLMFGETGLRKSEVVHLRWEDLTTDFGRLAGLEARHARELEQAEAAGADLATLRARHETEWSFLLGVVQVRPHGDWHPKNESSCRSVPVTRRLGEGLLERWSGLGGETAGYVFCTDGGRPLIYNVNTKLDRCLEAARVAKVAPGAGAGRNVHSFRHSLATRMLLAGVPVTTVSRWLGHAGAMTTLTVYAHVVPEALTSAARTIEEARRIEDARREVEQGRAVKTVGIESVSYQGITNEKREASDRVA